MSGGVEASARRVAVEEETVHARGYWRQSLHRLARQRVTLAALGVLLVLFVVGALAPQVAPHGWNWIDLSPHWRNHPPTFEGGHVFGTDNIGRDILTRTLWGLHYTEQTALIGALFATLLGVAVGAFAALLGGWPDATLMRIADLVAGFPAIILMIIAFEYFRPVSVWTATFVFALTLWTVVARITRARLAALAPEEFVQAARSLGATESRVFFKHLLPNAAGTIVVAATSVVGLILLVEATTEFFGYGIPSIERPTLGNLIGEPTSSGIGAYNIVGLGWWVWVAPAVLLVVLLCCVNLVGDGLDAALNPHTPRR